MKRGGDPGSTKKEGGGKKGGGKKGGAKGAPRSRRGLVRTRAVALAGLAGLALVAVQMLRGTLDLFSGAQRAGVLMLVVLAVEHVALPVARTLVGPQQPRQE